MKFLEKDLEEIIFEQLQTMDGRLDLDSRGLIVGDPTKCYRQCKIGNYGVADIVTYNKPHFIIPNDKGWHDSPFLITVYELKKDNIGISAFLQALRYCKGIQSYLEKHRDSNIRFGYKIVLIGYNLSESDFVYLEGFLDSEYFTLDVYTYKYSINGLKFLKREGYNLINEGF